MKSKCTKHKNGKKFIYLKIRPKELSTVNNFNS